MQTLIQVEPMTGAEFRRIRESLGLTQEKLAHVLDKTGRTVHRWETGPGPVDLTIALAMRQLAEEQAARRASETGAVAAPRKSVSGNKKR